MSAVTQLPAERRSIIATMAARYSMDPAPFEATLRATVVPNNCTREQFAACLVVANQYNLNPLTKEIFFFPARGGGIVPVVGVDGWARIINEHPAFDGMEFDTAFDDGKPWAVTCRMFRKDRGRPISITEYFAECCRPTDPWKQSPARMLRHKAMIQAARYAFGFAGIYDPDEAERINEAPREEGNATVAAQPRRLAPPPPPPSLVAPPHPPAEEATAADQYDPEALFEQWCISAQGAKNVNELGDLWNEVVGPHESRLGTDYERLNGVFNARAKELEP